MYQYTEDDVGPGWAQIVKPLIALCKERGVPVLQIKEKFGGLRFYVGATDPDDDMVHQAIDNAERMSLLICEECGQPGKLRTDLGWIKTLCDDHYRHVKGGKSLAQERKGE